MQVDYLAILAAAVAAMVVGMIYFNPKVAGTRWAGLTKVDMNDKSGMASMMVRSFVANLVIAYVLSYYLAATGAATVADGLVHALWLWLGLNAAVSYVHYMYERRPMPLLVLTRIYDLIVLGVMASVLVSMA